MGNQQGGAKTTFSLLHGSNIELLRDGTVATRRDKKNPTNAVLYTEQPIPVGCKFEVKLEEKLKYFNSNLKIGFTTFFPEESSNIAKSSDKLKTRFDHWILIGSSVWNGNVHWALKYDLETLSQGDIIGCRVREGGRLCIYVNGEYKRYKGQALANLPENEPLYGYVELCGDAMRVRALPVVDRSGGKGGGYVSGGGPLRHKRMTVTLPSKKSTAAASDPVPVETKKKSATMRLSGTSTSSLMDVSEDNSINRSMTLAVGGTNELLSMTSKRWKNRAFGSFHERSSPNIIFKENRGVALRKHPGDSNGFVFTQEPIRVEEKFVVRLLELNRNYHVSLGIGLTTLNPSTLDIPKSSVYLSHHPDYWIAISDTLRYNGALHKLPFNLDTLKCKSKIGMMVKFNGDLHIFLNDKDEGKICGGIDIQKPLYGFVDLAGRTVKIRSMFYSAKPVTTIFKEHGTEVEELYHQIANEVVDLITIHFQVEKAADSVSTQLERRASLVEASLGHWQTGNFTGSFSGAQKEFDSSSKFTLSFMKRLQHKVQSNEKRQQTSTVDTTDLHQSLQKSLSAGESNAESKKQIIDEEVEETMRQLLNPVAGDADDLASQIVDRIPDDIMGLLNIKLTSSKSLPVSATDPLESARAIILEVLVNAMSLELLDDESSAAINKNTLDSPLIKKKLASPFGNRKLLSVISAKQESTERPEPSSDSVEPESVISAQLLFSQLTTTIAHAVIEKLNTETTRSPLTSIESECDDGPPLPYLTQPDDNSNNVTSGDPGAVPTNYDAIQEYEEHVMVVTYGSFVGAPTPRKNDESNDTWMLMDQIVKETTTATTTDSNTTSKGQLDIDTSTHCQDHKSDDPSSTEKANINDAHLMDQTDDDTPSGDQKVADVPSIDHEANDTPFMDQRVKDTTVADQQVKDVSSNDQQVNDTSIMDQKADNTVTTDQKVKDAPGVKQNTNVFTDQGDDTPEVEEPPEEINKFLVLVTPFLIPRSDVACSMNSKDFGVTKAAKWCNNTDCSLQEFDLNFTKPENGTKFGKYLSVCAALSKLRHPNIQQLLGFVSQDDDSTKPSASIVTELIDLTLTKLLADHKCNEIQTTTHISICYDVAKAVSYLHLSKISHLLIRSDCVMVTRDYRAKLCDITSSLLYQSGLHSDAEMINANYLPADEMLPRAASAKTDTFSIGVLYLQTISHVAPYPVPIDETHNTEIERRQSHIDLVHSSHPLLPLIIICLSNKPDDRPTDEEICSVLEASLSTQD